MCLERVELKIEDLDEIIEYFNKHLIQLIDRDPLKSYQDIKKALAKLKAKSHHILFMEEYYYREFQDRKDICEFIKDKKFNDVVRIKGSDETL